MAFLAYTLLFNYNEAIPIVREEQTMDQTSSRQDVLHQAWRADIRSLAIAAGADDFVFHNVDWNGPNEQQRGRGCGLVVIDYYCGGRRR